MMERKKARGGRASSTFGRQAGWKTETSWTPPVGEKHHPSVHEHEAGQQHEHQVKSPRERHETHQRWPEEFDQQEHHAEPRRSERFTGKTDRNESRLAKAKGELKDLFKGSIKITVKITIAITITLAGIGVAANNRQVEQAWTVLGRSYPVPIFASRIVNAAHEASHSALAVVFAKPILEVPVHDSKTVHNPPYEPPSPTVHTAPESWCIQTRSIWASNPAFFPALPVELRENNCQHWGISAP